MLRISVSRVKKICVLYLLLWSVCPPLGLDMIYRLAALGGAAIWMFLSIRRGYKFNAKNLLFLLLVMVVAFIETQSVSGLLRPINLYMLCIACFMYDYYKGRMEELEGITMLIILLFVLFNVRTYVELLVNPNIARAIVRNDEEIYQFLRQGVGGYALVYMQVCIFPMVLSWFFQAFRRHKLQFTLGVLWLISFVLVISKAGYTIAITTCVVSGIVLFFYRGKSAVPAVVIALCLIFFTLAMIIYSEGFRNLLLTIFEGTTVTKKINDLVSSVNNAQAADSIAARIKRYQGSLEEMLQYPMIGGLWMRSGGGHSAILDTIAKYGWFGGYVFVMDLFMPLRTLNKYFPDKFTLRVLNATTVSVLIVAILDSLSFEFMFVIILFVPMLYQDMRNWRKE